MAKTKPKKQTKADNKATKKQSELIIVMVLSLILGLGGGYLIGAATSESTAETVTAESSMDDTDTTHMHSSLYEVPADQAPKVELVVSEDGKSGYNVKIIATDFTFTPEKVNEENILGEGHAHLYIDDVKIARVYGPYYHYDGDFEGSKTFRVTLNANDHSEYAIEGKVIESELVVTHDSSDPTHDDMHMDDDHMDNSSTPQ
jgi:hypothetical protein